MCTGPKHVESGLAVAVIDAVLRGLVFESGVRDPQCRLGCVCIGWAIVD